MSKEQDQPALTPEEKTAFEEASFSLFTFPALNLAEVTLPHIDTEISWLRRHVEEGSLQEESLILKQKTVCIDLQPCPKFLAPYINDRHLLGPILASARESGIIPTNVLWGANVEIKLPANSRWGVSSDEIESTVIPQVKDHLKTNREVRLPTVAELLYLNSRGFLINTNQTDHSLATREWTTDPFFSAKNQSNVLGRLTVSESVEKFASRGVNWWSTQGDFNRLPTLGFRLVVEVF